MLLRPAVLSALMLTALGSPGHAFEAAGYDGLDGLVAKHASTQGIPEALIHRVIRAESNYNPRASHGGHYGLMQISYATARGMGYAGPASGLLDADTNLAVGTRYLANAYRVSGGNQARAVRLYRSGFFYEAKRLGLQNQLAAIPVSAPATAPQPAPSGPASLLASLFGSPAPAVAQIPSETVATTGSVGHVRHRHARRHRG